MDFSNNWWMSGTSTKNPDGPNGGGGGDAGDPIGQSLRFRKDVSDLSKTGMTGGSKIYTVSFWTKHGDSFGNFGLGIGSNTGGTEDFLGVVPSRSGKGENSPQVFGNGSNSGWVTFSEQFRDYSGWYHYHFTYDVGKTGADRVHCYVNGVEVTKRASNTTVTLNRLFQNTKTTIGKSWYQNADCCAAEFYVIDGQALDPTTFGRYNSKGVWVPVDPKKDGDTAWYGANGFHLTFADPADIGKDISGNDNHFTANGFETTDQTSSSYDIMQDSPTNNFATLNPLLRGASPFAQKDANLRGYSSLSRGSGPYMFNRSAIPINQAGRKYYAEGRLWDTRGDQAWGFAIGVADTDSPAGVLGDDPGSAGWWSGASGSERRILNEGVELGRSPVGSEVRSGDDDNRAMIAVDYDKKAVYIGSNGSWIKNDNAGNITYDATFDANLPTLWDLDLDRMKFIAVHTTNASNAISGTINVGQQPFLYTPPAGFEPLSTANMPEPTIANGRDHFQAITDTGANILTAAQSAFPSGLWWIKDRVNANQHQFVDSIRGTATARRSPAGNIGNYAAPAGDSVAWCWNAPDEFNDTASDIDSTGRRNVDAGFAIRKYTGNGTTEQGIAHGLGKTPEFIIVFREETAAANTSVWHKDLTANVDSRLVLETNAAVATYAGSWSKAPDVTNIYVGTYNLTNKSGSDLTAYVWTSIPGYSAFGSYTGNANADGPFVYTGFRPAFVLIKKGNAPGTWLIFDSTRDTANPATMALRSDLTNAEVVNQGEIDFLSNGFKIRSTAAQMNASNSYIYAAFAECPFQSPVTAR